MQLKLQLPTEPELGNDVFATHCIFKLYDSNKTRRKMVNGTKWFTICVWQKGKIKGKRMFLPSSVQIGNFKLNWTELALLSKYPSYKRLQHNYKRLQHWYKRLHPQYKRLQLQYKRLHLQYKRLQRHYKWLQHKTRIVGCSFRIVGSSIRIVATSLEWLPASPK